MSGVSINIQVILYHQKLFDESDLSNWIEAL